MFVVDGLGWETAIDGRMRDMDGNPLHTTRTAAVGDEWGRVYEEDPAPGLNSLRRLLAAGAHISASLHQRIERHLLAGPGPHGGGSLEDIDPFDLEPSEPADSGSGWAAGDVEDEYECGG